MNLCHTKPTLFPGDSLSAGEPATSLHGLAEPRGTPVSEFRKQLEELEMRMCRQGNMHAFFLTTYVISMRKCERLIEAARNGDHPDHDQYAFIDADLVEQIATVFFRLYFEAFERYGKTAGEERDSPWESAFRISSNSSATPAQGMLSGLIAHSCYDLPLVLSTLKDNGEPVYDPDDSRHVATYDAISRLLTEELPAIAGNIHQTINAIRKQAGKQPSCLFLWLYRYAGKRVAALATYHILHAVHREAAGNSIKLQQAGMTEAELARIVNRRLHSIAGRPLSLRLLWLIISGLLGNRQPVRSRFKFGQA